MRSSFQYRVISIACFAVAVISHGNPSQAQQDLSALVEQSRAKFQPVTQPQVAKLRSELKQRMGDVERFVRPSSQNGQRWMRYLKWDALKQAVAEEQPKSLDPLDATLRQLNRNESGLERRQFRQLSDALRHYRDSLAVSMWQQPADIYNKQLEALQRDLEAYRSQLSPQTEMALSERLRIIDSIGQAPELVAALRRELAQPNAFVDISTSLVAAAADPINRREPVTDCILGTSIRSDAHTTGTVAVASIPSKDKAVLEFESTGQVYSHNVGHNGPAVIRSTANTDFSSTKRVALSDPAFVAEPASAWARTDTHLQSVAKKGGGLGSRLVSNIGMQRARESERQAESIASDHAQDRIERRFDDEVGDKIRDARERYEDEYRRPLERQGELPEHIRFSSDKDTVRFEAAQANRGQLGAPAAPPAVNSKHDVMLRLHQSAVNNYSNTVLGGATARQTKPNEDIKFDVVMPKWMKNVWKERKTESTPNAATDEPFKEYALTFRERRPVSVNFEGGKVKLTVHIAHLKSGDKSFSDWDVTGIYNPELANGGVTLRREGDLVMLPSGFDQSKDKLDSRQVAERRNLEVELNNRSAQGRGFPQAIEFDALTPEGDLADAGPLLLNEFASDSGWLVMAWDRENQRQARR